MRGGKRPRAGRPKGAVNRATADLQAAAREYTPQALETLVAIMTKSDSDAARVAAANAVLDRGYGKAKQTLDATVTEQRMVVVAPPAEPDHDEWVRKYGPQSH